MSSDSHKVRFVKKPIRDRYNPWLHHFPDFVFHFGPHGGNFSLASGGVFNAVRIAGSEGVRPAVMLVFVKMHFKKNLGVV